VGRPLGFRSLPGDRETAGRAEAGPVPALPCSVAAGGGGRPLGRGCSRGRPGRRTDVELVERGQGRPRR